jgi:hypothetical protein
MFGHFVIIIFYITTHHHTSLHYCSDRSLSLSLAVPSPPCVHHQQLCVYNCTGGKTLKKHHVEVIVDIKSNISKEIYFTLTFQYPPTPSLPVNNTTEPPLSYAVLPAQCSKHYWPILNALVYTYSLYRCTLTHCTQVYTHLGSYRMGINIKDILLFDKP